MGKVSENEHLKKIDPTRFSAGKKDLEKIREFDVWVDTMTSIIERIERELMDTKSQVNEMRIDYLEGIIPTYEEFVTIALFYPEARWKVDDQSGETCRVMLEPISASDLPWGCDSLTDLRGMLLEVGAQGINLPGYRLVWDNGLKSPSSLPSDWCRNYVKNPLILVSDITKFVPEGDEKPPVGSAGEELPF